MVKALSNGTEMKGREQTQPKQLWWAEPEVEVALSVPGTASAWGAAQPGGSWSLQSLEGGDVAQGHQEGTQICPTCQESGSDTPSPCECSLPEPIISAHYQSPSLGHTSSEAGLGPLSSLSWARRRKSRAGMGIFQAQHNSSLAAFVVKFMMKI